MQVEMKLEGIEEFAGLLEQYKQELRAELRQAFVEITTKWQREAVMRVPVEFGTLRQSIRPQVRWVGQELQGKVGSSVKYAAFIEFGTEHIAGGRVKALGLRPDVTDAQAIKEWPALAARGGTRQQMPWLRPGFMAIRDWAIARINKAVAPPGSQGL